MTLSSNDGQEGWHVSRIGGLSLRSQSILGVLRTSRADTVPEPPDEDGLMASDPEAPTVSRRAVLAIVGSGSLLIAVLTAGQTLGGVLRPWALLVPRGRSHGAGPNDFQINMQHIRAPSVVGYVVLQEFHPPPRPLCKTIAHCSPEVADLNGDARLGSAEPSA